MIEHCCWQLKSSSNSSVFHHCPNETSIAMNVIGSLRHYKRHIDFAVLGRTDCLRYASPAVHFVGTHHVIGKPRFKRGNEK